MCITLLYDPALTYADLAYLAVLFHIYPYTLHHVPTTTTSATTTEVKSATTSTTDIQSGTSALGRDSSNNTLNTVLKAWVSNITSSSNSISNTINTSGSSSSISSSSKPSYDSLVTSSVLAITLSAAGCPVLTILWLKFGGANANYLFFAGMIVWLCCGFIVAKLYRMSTGEGSER